MSAAGTSIFSLETTVDGARWVLTIVFGLAVIEKASDLGTRSAAWHPVILVSRLRRRFAGPLVGVSLVADFLTMGLLLVLPSAGGAISIILVLGYTIAAKDVHSVSGERGCRCFWRLPSTSTRAGLVVRNCLLLLLGILVLTHSPNFSGQGLVWGALLLGLVLAASRIADGTAKTGALYQSGTVRRRIHESIFEGKGAGGGKPAAREGRSW